MTPPIDWFRDPQLDGPTPVTVTPEGRVYGHIATWDTTHVGMPGKNVRPPRSRHDYSFFNTGVVEADDSGATVDVSAGRLTLDTGHAPLTSDAAEAASHYDNTGAVVANVAAGEDPYGIWFSGAIAPGVDDIKRHKLKSSSVSGDWRPIDGSLELVAALMVNSGGFPIPRARVASAAELVPLVAANIVPNPVQESEMPEIVPPTHSFKKGDVVKLVASGHVGEVVEPLTDNALIELVCMADELEAGTPEEIITASAKRTERQEMRRLAERVDQLTAALEARDRAEQAAALLADVEV
jgi:hypothetical protein